MRLLIITIFILFLFSCTKKETRNIELPSTKQEAMTIYEEGLKSMEDGQYLTSKNLTINPIKTECSKVALCQVIAFIL